MFARWKDEAACLNEMKLIHEESAARKLVSDIKNRVDNDTLFKSVNESPIVVIKGDDDEIYVYGPCTWEKVDPENDIITTQWMVSFMDKLFNAVPERYQNIMVDHRNFQGGVPLKSYTDKDGKEYLTHVHEKGMMLVSKVRDDDGLKITKHLRRLILEGVYKSYSVSGRSLKVVRKMEEVDGVMRAVKYHYDGEPIEVTYCKTGMNDMATYDVVSKSEGEDIYEFNAIVKEEKAHEAPEEEPEEETEEEPEEEPEKEIPIPCERPKRPTKSQEDVDSEVNETSKDMSVEQIEAKIKSLRGEIQANEDIVDLWYDSRPKMPDNVREAQEKTWMLRDELRAWQEARVEAITEGVKNETKSKPDESVKSLDELSTSEKMDLRQHLKIRGIMKDLGLIK